MTIMICLIFYYLIYSGLVSITGSKFAHISSWGSLVSGKEYIGFETNLFLFSYYTSDYQYNFAKRYPLNSNVTDWQQDSSWSLVIIQNSTVSDWLHEFRSKSFSS